MVVKTAVDERRNCPNSATGRPAPIPISRRSESRALKLFAPFEA